MKVKTIEAHDTEVTELFKSVFSVAEGVAEGIVIGKLVAELSARIDGKDIIAIGAYQDEILIGAIFFTRLTFVNNSILVYMLAPVAVSSSHQKQGVGQALINEGILLMKKHNVQVLITYGDPKYYSKMGFKPLAEATIQAPLPLSMPIGWQGQSLFNNSIPILDGRPNCVKAFDNPDYW